jgi:putative membrane protein
VKFLERFVANVIAVYLALYLLDSIAGGRFQVGGVWVAILLGLVLGFLNSLIRPLHRIRAKTVRALIVALLTLIANSLIVQVFAWATPLAIANVSWLLVAAVFLSVLMGVLNWLIGFAAPVKGRPPSDITRVRGPRASRDDPRNRIPRPRSPRS